MTHVMKIRLGEDIYRVIKLFTGEGCWRNGKYIHLHKIPKNDARYAMLEKKPRIKQVYNESNDSPLKGSTWFKLPNGKFIVINVRYGYAWDGNNHIKGLFWEMHYNEEMTAVYMG